MEARVEALEKELRELKMGKSVKKEKSTRKSNAYNEFMREEMAKLTISHSDMEHKEIFKLAASRYKEKKNQMNKL